jgi:hypothetical protein
MTVRDFRINVPNPLDTNAVASLRLEAVSEAELTTLGYALPPERLQFRAARVTTGGSASTLMGCLGAIWALIIEIVYRLLGRPAPLPPPLKVRLEPQAAVDVHVAIDVAGATGVAALRLVDRRGGAVVGGVTMLVLAGVANPPAREISVENPCPIVMERDPYWLPLGYESDATPPGGPMPAGFELQFLVWVTNRTTEVLDGAVAYLEHMGGGTVEFTPTTFNLGAFEPGATYPLRWRISTQGGAPGIRYASVVVSSSEKNPVRLQAAYELAALIPDEFVPVAVPAAEPA